MAHGRRLSALEVRDGAVDWAKQGFFDITDSMGADGRQLRLVDRASGRVATMPPELMIGVPQKRYEAVDICANFSYVGACVMLGANKLECHTLFPRFKRELVRRLSDDIGASAKKPSPVRASGKVASSGSGKDGALGSVKDDAPSSDHSSAKKAASAKKRAASNQPAGKPKAKGKKGTMVEEGAGEPGPPSPTEEQAAAGEGVGEALVADEEKEEERMQEEEEEEANTS